MNLCYQCFSEYDGGARCPCCGYDNGSDEVKYPLALPHGTVLAGRYVVGRVLGQGGFGITYVAEDRQDKKLVALKEYFPEQLGTRSGTSVRTFSGEKEASFIYGRECFISEAKTLSQFIGHPNIVCVYTYFEENNTAYFTMELIHGVTLIDYLNAKGGRISFEEAMSCLVPVMDALSAVHAKGIIHRDISPDNIYLTDEGSVKLYDFGAARYSIGDRSRSLDVVLKHGYAPKEQYARHGRQGPYTDVYALAATLYRAITGHVPPDAIERIEEDDLAAPSTLRCSLPTSAEDAIMKALSLSSVDRYQSVGEFKAALTAENPSLLKAKPAFIIPAAGAATAAAAAQPPADSAPAADDPQPDKVTAAGAGCARRPNRKRLALILAAAAAAVAAVILLVILLPKGRGADTTPDEAVETAAESDAASSEPGDAPNAVGSASGVQGSELPSDPASADSRIGQPTSKPSAPAPTTGPASKPATPAPTAKPTSKPATPAPTTKPTSKPATPAPTTKPTSKPATPAPTTKPTSKPATPASTSVKIVADGETYTVKTGTTITYTYYLSVDEPIMSFNSWTIYDTGGLQLLTDVESASTYPIIGSSVVAFEPDPGTIRYNFSYLKGKDFTSWNSVLIKLQFRVTAKSGTYDIDTQIRDLYTITGEKVVYSGEVLGDISRAEGRLTY